MATLETDEANILDAETVNWRVIVYPLLAVLVLVVGGFGYFYYLQTAREELESTARTALVAAKTPEEMIKVADEYPRADQATLALLGAADAYFGKHDYANSVKTYQRIIAAPETDPALHDPAQLGLASAFEALKNPDDAIKAYMEVATRGAASPFAPFAYSAVARIYEEKKDKDNERKTLTAAASLDPDSVFVKEAQFKLKELNPTPQPSPAPLTAVPAATTPVAAPAAK